MPAKRNIDYTATDKALELYARLLFSGKKLFLADLAREFNCSKSTVDRTMQAIERAGVGGVATGLESGRRWYQLKELPGVPNITLSVTDMEKLALVRDLLGKLLPAGIEKSVSDNIDKISAMLPKNVDRSAATASKALRVAWGTVDCTPFQSHMETMLAAQRKQAVCAIEYRDPEYRFPDRSRAPMKYNFLPVRLTSEAGTLNMEGWLVKDMATKEVSHPLTCELHRLLACKQTETVFKEIPPLPERKGAFGLVGFKPFRAVVCFSEEFSGYIRERTWSDDQKIVELEDGEIELHFWAADEDELMRWVFGFTGYAELIEPAHLREAMLDEAAYIWELYAPEEYTGQPPERAEMVNEILDFLSKADTEQIKSLARKAIWQTSESEAE